MSRVATLVLAFAVLAAGQALGQSAAALAQATAAPTSPPKLAFKSHYLVDFATDTVLASSDADTELPPASLTKLMTAYVVFEAIESGRIRLDDHVRVSEKAWRMGGTRMFIEVNSEVGVEDLIRGMLIQSGNDASVALAEHVAGSVDAFVAEMNATAEKLGLTHSAFRNPHGLPARGHYSTARDLAVLARTIIEEFPAFYSLYAEREFSYNAIRQQNRNALLWRDASVDGLKTGYRAPTARARNDGAQKLLEYGFANFETHKVYSAGQELDDARVRGGESTFAALGIAEDVYVTIPRGSYPQLAASMDVMAELAAPLLIGTQVGEVKISLAGTQLATSPVIVLTGVTDGGVWARMRDELATFWE